MVSSNDDDAERTGEDTCDLLDLPLTLWAAIDAVAEAADRDMIDVLEQILQDAIEPIEPELKKAKLRCDACATITPHRFARSTLTRGGVWAHRWGCLKCFHMRVYGQAETPSARQCRLVKKATPTIVAVVTVARPVEIVVEKPRVVMPLRERRRVTSSQAWQSAAL